MINLLNEILICIDCGFRVGLELVFQAVGLHNVLNAIQDEIVAAVFVVSIPVTAIITALVQFVIRRANNAK